MTAFDELKEKISGNVHKYSQKSGYPLDPDQETVSMIIEGLAKNKERYGYAYCPCRVVTGDPAEDRKIICPCIYHRDEIAKDGHCHCHLYTGSAPQVKKRD
ncbi:MAG: ferredoxin-thioredoxin reductase catalytic domain-containing protein [bacterium]